MRLLLDETAAAVTASPTFVNALPVTLLRAAAPSVAAAATTAAAAAAAPAPAAVTATATAAAATTAAADTAATPAQCRSCGAEFPSKGKLFKHLRSGGTCSVAAGLAPPPLAPPLAPRPPARRK